MLNSLVDRLRTDFRQGNSAELARLHILLVHGIKGHLHLDLRITASELEDVEMLPALELRNAVVEGAASILRRSINSMSRRIDAAFDANDDFACVFGVFLEVSLEEDETVVVWRAVELPSVPEGAYSLIFSIVLEQEED